MCGHVAPEGVVRRGTGHTQTNGSGHGGRCARGSEWPRGATAPTAPMLGSSPTRGQWSGPSDRIGPAHESTVIAAENPGAPEPHRPPARRPGTAGPPTAARPGLTRVPFGRHGPGGTAAFPTRTVAGSAPPPPRWLRAGAPRWDSFAHDAADVVVGLAAGGHDVAERERRERPRRPLPGGPGRAEWHAATGALRRAPRAGVRGDWIRKRCCGGRGGAGRPWRRSRRSGARSRWRRARTSLPRG